MQNWQDYCRPLTTELAQWQRFVRDRPNDPGVYVRRGMTYFKLASIKAAIADFDRAEALDPQLAPYLWQRGLAYYYARRYEEGAKQFALDLTVNEQDAEETLWRYLCLAQLEGAEIAKAMLLPVKGDSRPIMHEIWQLFHQDCGPESVLRAGERQGATGKFYSQLYVGLYWEAQGDPIQSQTHIKQAIAHKLNDYMWHLACVHQQLSYDLTD